jgi:hypothetical protein
MTMSTRLANAAVYLADLANEIEREVEYIEARTLAEACTFYVGLKADYEALNNARLLVYNSVDKLNKQIIPSKLNAAGVDKIQIPELAKSFYIATKYSASIIDKTKGYEWLRENNYGDVIGETVNAGTLAALCKSMILDDGIDPPEELIKFSSYETTGVSKYTPKEKV